MKELKDKILMNFMKKELSRQFGKGISKIVFDNVENKMIIFFRKRKQKTGEEE